MLTCCFITLGDPATLTGGYRYHRRVAEPAAHYDARLTFVSLAPRLPLLHGGRALRAADNADVVLVGWVQARLDRSVYKRCQTVVAASELLSEWLDHAVVVPHLAGDEWQDTSYGQRVSRRLGALSDCVTGHGPCDDAEVGRLHRSADLFALPSRWETYGTVCAPGDVRGLALALRRLAEDEPGRRRMGAAAARRACGLPTWEQSAQNFFGILAAMP